jgi:hypothetical protein
MASCYQGGHVTGSSGPGERLSVVDPWAADRFWARCCPPRVSASAAGELDGRGSMPRIAGVSDRQADRRRTSPATARLGFCKTGLNDGADRPAA